MSWTAPKTWAVEIPDAAGLNLHVRDNMLVLKTSIDDAGKFRALTSAYVADLSGANLTGIAQLAGAISHAAGRQDFNGATTRIVVPVGADKYDGSPGNKTAGSIWVEGDYLHHVASNQNEWRYLGNSLGAPGGGAVAGSVWIDTSSVIHYVDASVVERQILTSVSPHTDGAAVAGSAWVETYVHWSPSGGIEYQGHADTHTDGTQHNDTAHTDTHSDTHTDAHSDVSHDDYHYDQHQDVTDPPHTDGPYTDTFHDDYHADTHTDNPHTDSHSDTHNDTHGDVTHADHTDHGDVAHADAPESVGA